jgi:hypothetical protein
MLMGFIVGGIVYWKCEAAETCSPRIALSREAPLWVQRVQNPLQPERVLTCHGAPQPANKQKKIRVKYS